MVTRPVIVPGDMSQDFAIDAVAEVWRVNIDETSITRNVAGQLQADLNSVSCPVDTAQTFTTDRITNGNGGTGPSGEQLGSFTLNVPAAVTLTHTGTNIAGTSPNSGLGIRSASGPDDANTWAAADIYDTAGDRITPAVPTKIYTTPVLPAGTYWLGVFAGGQSSVDVTEIAIEFTEVDVPVCTQLNDIRADIGSIPPAPFAQSFTEPGPFVTTSNAFVSVLAGAAQPLPSDGVYEWVVSYGWTVDSTAVDFRSNFTATGWTDSGAGDLHRQEAQDAGNGGNVPGTGSNQRHGFTRHLLVTYAAGEVPTFDLSIATPNVAVEVGIWDAAVILRYLHA